MKRLFMQVLQSAQFQNELKNILEFIAKDSLAQAMGFKNQLKIKIDNILAMPFMYKKSSIFEDENIREMVFKGYVIVYRVSENLELLGIYKSNLWNYSG